MSSSEREEQQPTPQPQQNPTTGWTLPPPKREPEDKRNAPIKWRWSKGRRERVDKKRQFEVIRMREDLKHGLSETEIMRKYNMSWGKFWTRMNEIRMEDNDLLLKHIRQEGSSMLVVDMKKLDDRLGDGIQHMDSIISDQKASHFVKLEAQRLRLEIALAQFKLKVEGPRLLEELMQPVANLAEGKTTPMGALESLPKLKYYKTGHGEENTEAYDEITTKQLEAYKKKLDEDARKQVVGEKRPWVQKVQAENENQDSVGHQEKVA